MKTKKEIMDDLKNQDERFREDLAKYLKNENSKSLGFMLADIWVFLITIYSNIAEVDKE